MEVSEKDKREAFASELADIFHRQEAILQCNEILSLTQVDRVEKKFESMDAEDIGVLHIIENTINSFGLRLAPREGAMAMADFIMEQLQDEAISPIEQLGFYTMIKQNQMLSCHILHKALQISDRDIRLALDAIDDVYSIFSKQVAGLVAYTEEFSVKWITGEKPDGSLLGRAKDAFATVSHAVSSRVAKPNEEKSVLKILAGEHRKVEALFQEIKDSESFGKAKELFEQLKADLTAHSVAEEDTVYNYFRQAPELSKVIVHAQSEHQELRNLLDEVSYLAQDEDAFMMKLDALEERVNHHVREEEGPIFAAIEENARKDELVSLSRAFLDKKRGIQINIGQGPIAASLANVPIQPRVGH